MAYEPELEAAIERAGGVVKLSQGLGITPSAIPQWKRVPAKHVPAGSRLTGIPRHELRPDMWDPPSDPDSTPQATPSEAA